VDLITTCISHPVAANQTFMVSDGDDLSTLRLTRLIGQACGVPVRTLPVPVFLLNLVAKLLGKRDMFRRLTDSLQVDISVTCKRLDWQPPQSVSHGMQAAFGEPRRGVFTQDSVS
jgi:nucleoside-diphosphate-sugar epimerase